MGPWFRACIPLPRRRTAEVLRRDEENYLAQPLRDRFVEPNAQAATRERGRSKTVELRPKAEDSTPVGRRLGDVVVTEGLVTTEQLGQARPSRSEPTRSSVRSWFGSASPRK